MKTIKEILVSSFLALSLGAISNITVAAQTGMTQPINNTIAHLDAALSAVDADDLEVAQEHINAARQWIGISTPLSNLSSGKPYPMLIFLARLFNCALGI